MAERELHGDLEALVTEVHRRAEQRALEREAAARKRAAEVLENARNAAAQELERRHRRATTQADEQSRRVLAQGELEALRLDLRAREALLEAVWGEAARRLETLRRDPEEYGRALERLLALAAATLGAAELDVEVDAADADAVTDERATTWGSRLGVRVTVLRRAGGAGAEGGIVVRSGRLAFDAGFATRLSEARTLLRVPVWHTLAQALGDGAPALGRRAADRGATDPAGPHGPDEHAPDEHAPDPYAPDPHAPEPHAADPHATDPYAPDRAGAPAPPGAGRRS